MTIKKERAQDRTVEILVVEDSPTQAEHLVRLLVAEAGWQVRLATDGRAALDEVRRRPPALVISDIAMPGMDGFTLCRTLKDEPAYAAIPVVLLTRLSTLHDIVRGLDAGADSFVPKPFDADDLRTRLRRLLAQGAAGGLELMAAERRQIHALLLATHEETLRTNAMLAEQQTGLQRSVRSLAVLGAIAGALNEAATEQDVAQAALDHLAQLPGFKGVGVSMFGADNAPRLLAGRGLAAEDMQPGACPGTRHLCLPLASGGPVDGPPVGMLHLLPARRLDADERALLDNVAKLVAPALARARLYARTEALVAERTEALRYVSHFDTLTGLPNRLLLHDRLSQMRAQAAAAGEVLGFMLLRFTRMPLVRETLGPEADQGLVLQAGQRLREIGCGDAVARISDGSFALLAVRPDSDALAAAARRLLAALGAPYVYGTEELHLDPCVGIAVYPTDGEDYEALARSAEAAVREAADGVLQRYAFYRPELNCGANDRFKMETALRRAVDRNELVLHYQPQIDLATGAIVGAEALLRWNHPERGIVQPSAFITLAEESGLILPIGTCALMTACAQLRYWQEAGLPVVPVSVNLSVHQFSDQIVGTVKFILDAYGVDPALLELELTESASMADAGKSYELLAQLKAMGIRLAIDDFGTGYSNLNYLKRFPVDKLKLDKSFVDDILEDGDDLAISRAVIAMAHGLRLTVVAEGVETAGQLAVLAGLGCDLIQGYYYSRPVPPEEFARMLVEGCTPGG